VKHFVFIVLILSISSPSHSAPWWKGASTFFSTKNNATDGGAVAPSNGTDPNPQLRASDFINENVNGDAAYIGSNEFDNFDQFARLSPTAPNNTSFSRATIAVGTFRAFHLGAALRRDYLVSLDFAPGISHFNMALANVISHYGRREFLRLVLLQDSFNANSPEEEPQLVRQFANLRLADSAVSAEGALLATLATPFADDAELKFILHTLNEESHRKSFYKALLESTKNPQRWQASFWGNEDGYLHLQKLIRGQHFLALTGSLSGKRTVRSIAQFFTRYSIVASEIDVSNALQSIVGAEKRDGIIAFVSNLSALPVDEKSRVLLTLNALAVDQASVPQGVAPLGRWYYRIYTVDHLKQALGAVSSSMTLSTELLRTTETRQTSSRRKLSCEGFFKLTP